MSGLVGQFPYLGLFALLILGGVGLPFPEDSTLILCGFLISHEVVRPVPAISVIYAGLLTADFFLYSVGKKYGRQIVNHRRFRKIVSPEKLAIIEEKFKKRGVLVILLGRHIFGLRAQLFLAAGTMRMSAIKFILADGVSALFTIAIMAGAGYAGGYGMKTLGEKIIKIRNFSAVTVSVLIAAIVLFRYIRSKRSGMQSGEFEKRN